MCPLDDVIMDVHTSNCTLYNSDITNPPLKLRRAWTLHPKDCCGVYTLGNPFAHPGENITRLLQTEIRFDYDSSFLQRLHSGNRICCSQNLISVCTLKQSSGSTSSGFTNIQSNWNMSRSDWKCSPVHKYWLNQLKWTFTTYITEGVRYIFPRVGEWVTQRGVIT